MTIQFGAEGVRAMVGDEQIGQFGEAELLVPVEARVVCEDAATGEFDRAGGKEPVDGVAGEHGRDAATLMCWGDEDAIKERPALDALDERGADELTDLLRQT